jgi:hypothetical protein
MRITVRINENLLLRAKSRAAEEGRSLTSLIEEALALVVARPKASRRGRVELPVSKASGGVLPGIDLNRSSDLEEAMNKP